MFDSKIAINQLLEKAQKEVTVATDRAANISSMLAALPDDIPAPADISTFGYCAHGTLRFDTPEHLELLVEKLPPLELVRLQGFEYTIKPAKCVRDQEAQYAHILSVYPVLLEMKDGRTPVARWWTQLADRDVEVGVYLKDAADASAFFAKTDELWSPDTQSHGGTKTYTNHRVRRLKTDFPVSPLEVVNGKADFIEAQRWLTAFFVDYGGFDEQTFGGPIMARVQACLRRDTALDVVIGFSRCYRTHVEVRLYDGQEKPTRREHFVDVEIALNAEKPRLRLQDIPVTYKA
ncbi:hypothetical protein F6X40_27730 [Paraburkholderia sp. UCT31]|uniref:hypothetical protein n=1 Tax=Paraburkholderia sp. UCT31 TaxID=2615209 RepID=UPI001656112F|nr:hypothetical protein [Paraburkholderia sp. UCT31]MBC8740430.1 hypothetical protein [Paraburkholderia sp. UCT31]